MLTSYVVPADEGLGDWGVADKRKTADRSLQLAGSARARTALLTRQLITWPDLGVARSCRIESRATFGLIKLAPSTYYEFTSQLRIAR